MTPDGVGCNNVADCYQITGITGFRNGVAITGLEPVSPPPLSDGTWVDNLIFFAPPTPTSPATFTPSDYYDNNAVSGFAYSVVGGSEFQAWTWAGGVYPGSGDPNSLTGGQYEYQIGTWPGPGNAGLWANTAITFDIGVPEPTSIVLLSGMLLGLAGALRRKLA